MLDHRRTHGMDFLWSLDHNTKPQCDDLLNTKRIRRINSRPNFYSTKENWAFKNYIIYSHNNDYIWYNSFDNYNYWHHSNLLIRSKSSSVSTQEIISNSIYSTRTSWSDRLTTKRATKWLYTFVNMEHTDFSWDISYGNIAILIIVHVDWNNNSLRSWKKNNTNITTKSQMNFDLCRDPSKFNRRNQFDSSYKVVKCHSWQCYVLI